MNTKSILHESWAVFRVVIARLRFIMVFVVAAFIVGYWDNVTNYVDKWTRPMVAPDSLAKASTSDIEFYCTMHPHVVREEPGSCPICGMPLTKRKKGEAQRLPADVLARVQLTPQRVALANVHTSAVESREMMYDVDAVGVLDYDETKLARISARVAGRADKLFVTYVGQPVKSGDPLYSIYSPAVFTALREYLSAQKRFAALGADAGGVARQDAATVLDASKQRMILWGVTEAQLGDFEKANHKDGQVATEITITSPISGVVVAKSLYEGGYVQTGDNVFTVADLSKLWLQAKLYEQDVPLVHVGDVAKVVVDAMPNDAVAGKVAFEAVRVDPQTRTLDARIEVDNPGQNLRPGMFARATIRIPVAKGPVLAVPRSAVIDTGRNKIVYVQSAEGVYDMHAVKLGPAAGDYYPVLGGLREGQSVVTIGAFLIDAENRLNPSVNAEEMKK